MVGCFVGSNFCAIPVFIFCFRLTMFLQPWFEGTDLVLPFVVFGDIVHFFPGG